jgi:hypothetical protein
MKMFTATYRVVIAAEDVDEAALMADDIECAMLGIKYVQQVYSDPYIEELK